MSDFPVPNGYKLWYCHSRTSSSSKREIMNQLPSERKCLFKQAVLAVSTGNGYLLPSRNGPASSTTASPITCWWDWHGGRMLDKSSIWRSLTYPRSTQGKIWLRAFSPKTELCLIIDSVKFITNAFKKNRICTAWKSSTHSNDKCLQHCPLLILTTGMECGQGRGRAERKGRCWVSSYVLLSFSV